MRIDLLSQPYNMNVIWLMKLMLVAMTISATVKVGNDILSQKRRTNENERGLLLVTDNTPTVLYQK